MAEKARLSRKESSTRRVHHADQPGVRLGARSTSRLVIWGAVAAVVLVVGARHRHRVPRRAARATRTPIWRARSASSVRQRLRRRRRPTDEVSGRWDGHGGRADGATALAANAALRAARPTRRHALSSAPLQAAGTSLPPYLQQQILLGLGRRARGQAAVGRRRRQVQGSGRDRRVRTPATRSSAKRARRERAGEADEGPRAVSPGLRAVPGSPRPRADRDQDLGIVAPSSAHGIAALRRPLRPVRYFT